jgi:DNA-directed RNA polymerase subunit N (RpoN/RPB10)
MPCPHCNEMISKDAIACFACGKSTKAEPEAAAEAAPQARAPAAESDEKPCPHCNEMISREAILCFACGKSVEKKEIM